MNYLSTAAARREIRYRIHELLVELRPEDQRVVLEDLLEEVVTGMAVHGTRGGRGNSVGSSSWMLSPPSGLDGLCSFEGGSWRAFSHVVEPDRGQDLPRGHVTGAPAKLTRDVEREQERTLVERIREWCLETSPPPHDRIFMVKSAAEALLPKDQRGTTKIYIAVLRSSPQSDRKPPEKPRFVWLGDGRFTLYFDDARATTPSFVAEAR